MTYLMGWFVTLLDLVDVGRAACGRPWPMGSVAITPSEVTTNIDWALP